MTSDEALRIKKMVEGIWHNNQTPEADILWITMLEDENFICVYKALQSFIKQNKLYTPKLPEIISKANDLDNLEWKIDDIQNLKLRDMVLNGYLGNDFDSLIFKRTIRKLVIGEHRGILPRFVLDDIKNWKISLSQNEEIMKIA